MKTRSVPSWSGSRFSLWLKLFLPSWNFFDDFDAVSRIDVGVVAGGGREIFWRPLHPARSRCPWWRMFFNPVGNLELLEQSLVDRVVTELRGQESTAGVVPHPDGEMMLIRLVQLRAAEFGADSARGWFRFRLLLVAADGAEQRLYESGPYPFREEQR